MNLRTVEVIRKKLDYLEQTLAELEPYLQTSYAEYARQPAHRRATERLVQIITLDNRILFNSAKRLRKDAQTFLKAITRYLVSTQIPKAKKNDRR